MIDARASWCRGQGEAQSRSRWSRPGFRPTGRPGRRDPRAEHGELSGPQQRSTSRRLAPDGVRDPLTRHLSCEMRLCAQPWCRGCAHRILCRLQRLWRRCICRRGAAPRDADAISPGIGDGLTECSYPEKSRTHFRLLTASFQSLPNNHVRVELWESCSIP